MNEKQEASAKKNMAFFQVLPMACSLHGRGRIVDWLWFLFARKPKGRKDYIFCEDCNCFCDFWKYDSLEDTGHAECTWRFVTVTELRVCIQDCRISGCFEEQFI